MAKLDSRCDKIEEKFKNQDIKIDNLGTNIGSRIDKIEETMSEKENLNKNELEDLEGRIRVLEAEKNKPRQRENSIVEEEKDNDFRPMDERIFENKQPKTSNFQGQGQQLG